MIINGNTYEMPEIDFNAVCHLDECKYDILNASKDVSFMTQLRAIIGLVCNTTADKAGKLIDLHIANGGDFQTLAQEVFEEFNKAVENSGFLQQATQSFGVKQEKPNKKNSKSAAVEAQET